MKLFLLFIFLASTLFANEKVVLQLKWLHQFQFAGYYAAIEKGFYKDVGLDVAIRQRELNKNTIEQVINQEANYGVADSTLLLYRAKNKPVVIVSPIFQHSPSVILTLKSTGLDSPYKLENKNLLFYKKDTDGFAILAMLKNLEITPTLTRERDRMGYQDLIDGRIDALSAYLTNEPFYFKEKGISINILNPLNYGLDLYGDMLFTNEDEAKNHPQRVEKFKDATLKGWQYALEHKEEIIKLIKEKYAPTKSLEHLRYEADAIEQMIQNKTIPLGTLDKGRIKYTLKMYEEHGLIKNNIPVDNYIFELYNHNRNQISKMLNDKELDYLKNKKVLKMCIAPDWMPYEKNDHGNHIGMSADFITLIQKDISIPIKMVDTKTWAESLKFGEARKCDIFSTIMPLPSRKKYLDFTMPYAVVPLVLATEINELFIDNIHKLKDKDICIVRGYGFLGALEKHYPNLNFFEVNTLSQGLKLVKSGELFGCIDALSTIGYQIQKEYIGQLKIATKLDETIKLTIGTRNDEPILVDIFNKSISMISEDERQHIMNTWISVNYQRGVDYIAFLKWFGVIISIFLVITFIILKSNRRLNKEIEYRKVIEHKLTRYVDLVDRYIIISSTDLDGVITEASEAFCKISGFSKEEIIGKRHSIIRCPKIPNEFYELMWKDLIEQGHWVGEIRNKSKNGDFYWVKAFISAIYDLNGKKIGYTGITENITDAKLLKELSITDELTKIYNRRYFNEIFPKIINSAKRNNDVISFCILDVDFFKLYNDTYGHMEGDNVLKMISKTIQNSLNRADDFCFRLGGEEFGILIKGLEPEKAKEFIENIRMSIENLKIKHEKNNVSIYVTASFGLVIQDANSIISFENIYKAADELLYKAKERGRNKVISNITTIS